MKYYIQINDPNNADGYAYNLAMVGAGVRYDAEGKATAMEPPKHSNLIGPFDEQPSTAGKRFNMQSGQLEDLPLTEIQKFLKTYPPEKMIEMLQDDSKHSELKAASVLAAQELAEGG